MNRFCLCFLGTVLAVAPVAMKADTILNLNGTTGNASTSYGGGYNNLAPSFYQTVTLAAGNYTISAVGAGTTAGDGTSAVYSGLSFASTGTGPAPNSFREEAGFSMGGIFSNASSTNGYQNSYGVGSINGLLFAGNYSSTTAALAAAIPVMFTLTTPTTVTFYAYDSSYLPSGDAFGFDDNSGGISLDIKAVTPEPSSLMLLGTGILSAAGVVRRRMKA